MKVGLPTFMLTADELMTVQAYKHENGEAIFIGTANEPTTVQKYAMKTSDGFS
jgi:hypothetical protein